MCTMLDISKKPSNSDSLLRVYRTECHINARAARLLGLHTNTEMVKFTYDDDELSRGRLRVYVCRCEANTPRSFEARRLGRSYRIYSTEICSALADHLSGFGCYRICPEVSKTVDDKTFYEIFFKKFE